MAKQELVVNGSGFVNEVAGKLKKNTLKNGGAYIISLEKKLLDVSTIVQNMCDETGANPLEVMKILGDYQNCILKHLGKGYSVKVLDLLTVQPSIRGSVDNKEFTQAEMWHCDLDGDEIITSNDALLVLRKSVGYSE